MVDRLIPPEGRMSFFNSLPIRIALAVLGGGLYALLTYALVLSLQISSSFAALAAFFVYLLYLGSRLLLFGIDSPYYPGIKKGPPRLLREKNSFHETAQWVGKFYHRHDRVLFVFLCFLSVVFLVSLVMDGLGGKPLGETLQNLWNSLVSIP